MALNLVAALVLVLLARPSKGILLVAPVVGWGVLLWRSDIASYGGLSGLLHAHVGDALVQSFRNRVGFGRAVGVLGVVVLLGKAAMDLVVGGGALSGGLDLGFVPVPESHVIGSLGGIVLGLLRRRSAPHPL